MDAAEQVTVQITLLREQYQAIEALAAANEWEPAEGLLTVLMSGLGYLDATLRIEGLNDSPDKSRIEEQLESLIKDLASYHSMYAVMKYTAFKMYKINQTLEFNVAGLRATERMWEEWAERMRKEQTDLRAEVLRLRSLLSEFSIDVYTGKDGALVTKRLDEVLPGIIPSLREPVSEAKAQMPPAPTESPSQTARKPSLWARLFGRRG